MQVKADVTEGSAKLAEAIGNDAEAVICATGFQPSWDLLAPWKVSLLLTGNAIVNLLFFLTIFKTKKKKKKKEVFS